MCSQFPIYETLMKHYKDKLGKQEFEKHEFKYNLAISLFTGCVSAALTNPLECIAVNKMAKTDFQLVKFVKQEGFKNLWTKGLLPRVCLIGLQSMLFFTLVVELGKIYDVQLGDE